MSMLLLNTEVVSQKYWISFPISRSFRSKRYRLYKWSNNNLWLLSVHNFINRIKRLRDIKMLSTPQASIHTNISNKTVPFLSFLIYTAQQRAAFYCVIQHFRLFRCKETPYEINQRNAVFQVVTSIENFICLLTRVATNTVMIIYMYVLLIWKCLIRHKPL